MSDFKVTVYEEERKKEFEKVFGSNTVNVKSPIPNRITIPSGETKLAYFLDFESITKEQQEKLVEHISVKFNQQKEFVEKNIESMGVPILKEQCSLCIENPQRWF